MQPLVLRPSIFTIAFHWFSAILLLWIALLTYLFVFFTPYRGVILSGCPTACAYNEDCRVPHCGSKRISLECHNNRCQLPSGHQHFFSASLIFISVFLGIAWLILAIYKTTLRLVIDQEGLHYSRFRKTQLLKWDDFLGITYHGVMTRLGRNATVYSLTGDFGIISLIAPGLPPDTSTREIEMGAFFFISISETQCKQLLELIETHSGKKPEPEREW